MPTEMETLVETLVSAGVLVEYDEGDRVDLSQRFVRERDAQREKVKDTKADVERVASSIGADPDTLDETMIADALAVRTVAPGLDDHTAVLAADALERFANDTLTEGVPDGFVPVRANEVSSFVEQHDGAIVYFWGDDCEPCEEMRQVFDTLREEGSIPGELGLGAVYLGREADIEADAVDLIADEWMVTLVPTTLFFLDGRSDARYYGWEPKEAVEREIEILMGYVRGDDLSLDVADTTGEGAREARATVEDQPSMPEEQGTADDQSSVPGESGTPEGQPSGQGEPAADAIGDDVQEARGLVNTGTADVSPDLQLATEFIEKMTADDENISIGIEADDPSRGDDGSET